MRTRAEQIAVIRADQQFWRDLAAEVGPARYTEPGPMGDWSFGDMAGQLVAHYDASYDRLIRALEALPDAMLMTVIEWVGEPLIDVDFSGHLHDEHDPSVRAWLDAHPR